MKKLDDDDMLPEHDFSGGVRGKHHKAMQAGYTITVHQEDGSTIVKDVKPKRGTVVLEPDVREYFPDSDSVNRALRTLITLIPKAPTRVRRPSSGTIKARPAHARRS